MIRGREASSKGALSADLLVCFPSRAHLTLMPKQICSPARHSESSKRQSKSRFHHQHHLKKSSTRNGGQGSPLLWGKTKSMGDEITEPTSPKVTCAGQIKVRPKTTSCRNWQSVMEEIEKIHNDKNQRKRSSWVESLGFKKEIVQFLTCLRSIHFDFRCFGSLPAESDITTDDEEDEDELEGYQENHADIAERETEGSKTVFSKWFMVLQEDQHSNRFFIEDEKQKGKLFDEGSNEPTVPPPNALLLMRCRSAPAKSWLEEKEQKQEKSEENDNKEQDGSEKEAYGESVQRGRSLRSLMEEEKKNKENLVVMMYESDVYKISCDIAKETWLVGGLKDSLLIRSRSSKR